MARAERAVADHGDPALAAPGHERMLDRPFLEVVEDLVARDPTRPGDRDRALHPVDVEVADAPGACLPARDELLEGGDRLLQRMPARPVEQVDVEPIRPEPPERRLAGGDRALAGGVSGQHLRHEEDLVAPPGDRLPDDLFDPARAVHLGGVDMGHAGIDAGTERGDRSPPVALHVPGALPDDGHADARRPEGLAPQCSASYGPSASATAGSARSTGSTIFTSTTASKGVSDAVTIATRAPAARAAGTIWFTGPTTSDEPAATRRRPLAAAAIARSRSAA